MNVDELNDDFELFDDEQNDELNDDAVNVDEQNDDLELFVEKLNDELNDDLKLIND